MLKNYFRIAIRNLTRNRFSSAINIGGLAIGMAVAILIGLWIYDELSFDRATPNHDRIASVMQNNIVNGDIQTWSGQAMQLAPVLRKNYGGLFRHVVIKAGASPRLVTYGDKKLKPIGDYMEPGAIDMLGLRMLGGDTSALNDPSSVILSSSLAAALFGEDRAIGKIIKLDNTSPLKVTGVYADFPANSSFANTQLIAPWQLLVSTRGWDSTLQWGNSWFGINVQLNDNVDLAAASKAIKLAKLKYGSSRDQSSRPELFLQPMNRWHLYSEFKDGVSVGGRIRFVRLYALIGAFVLLLACINFMNLSTARSEKRAKEVGIRKAIGSLRGQLVRQFFSESLVVAMAAFVLAIGIAQLLLPFFNGVADKKVSIPWGQPLFWLAGLCFTVLTGLLAGSYPALYLSSFQPVKVLKGTFRVGKLAAVPRKALVVVQFAVSVILIVGTIGILHQIQYAKDRPVGYNRAGLISVPLQNLKPDARLTTLRREFKATGYVQEVAGSESSAANTYTTNMGFSWRGKDPRMQDQFVTNGITPEFGAVAGWQLLEGRDFSQEYGTDSSTIILNEAAVRYMNFKHPVGEIVRWGDNGLYTVVGVVKDMIAQSPYDRVQPMIFYIGSYLSFSHLGVIDIRLRPQAAMSRALAAIGSVFKKFDPEDPFQYQFVDQEYAKKFGDEERIGRLAGFFALLAILISCLGLLGLSSFVAEQRTREIGVRKVLGASILNLWQLLSQEFVWLVGLSLLIGGPLSYWIMHGWLENYAYHASLSWWIFAVTAFGAIALTLLTVSFQAVKAALASPVHSLRAE